MKISKLVTANSIVGALLAVTASVGTAVAAPPASSDVVRVAVSYADLDLTTQDGIQALHRRVLVAARTVCPAPRNADVKFRGLARDCRAQAIEAAVRSIGNPALVALHTAGRQRG